MNYLFDDTNPVADKLNDCACIEAAYKDDGYPQHICGDCIAQLIVAHQFKELCEKNDAQLRTVEINKIISHCDIMDNDQENIIVDTIDNMHEIEIRHVEEDVECKNAIRIEAINDAPIEHRGEEHLDNINEVQIENINKVEVYDNILYKIEQQR